MKFKAIPIVVCKIRWLSPKILMVMKLTILLLIVCLVEVSAKSYGQKISLNLNNAPIQQLIASLEKQTGYVFVYDNHEILNVKITAAINNATIDEALDETLKKLPFTYKIIDNTIVISKKDASLLQKVLDVFSPPIKIKGIIQTEGHFPLKDVVIKTKGSSKGTLSNERGEFELSDVPDGAVIQISFIGYKMQEFALEDIKTPFIVILEIDRVELNEVKVRVSNGYNDLPKDRATGSFGIITAKQIEQQPQPNIINRLEGQIPGLLITLPQSDRTFVYRNPTNILNSNVNYGIQIRGVSTLNANTAPLIVVDGAISELDLSTINPNDIQQITVLKDAAAASIWGIRAANGVIVIQTKRGKISAPKVSFSANYLNAGRPRLNYIPQMNAAQTIDYEQDLVDRGIITDPLGNFAPRYVDQAQELMFQFKRGNITQAQRDNGLSALSNSNSYDQIQKYLLRPATSQQYNLGITGGSATATYYYSASYAHENTNDIGTDGQRLTLTANNEFKILNFATLTSSLTTSLFKSNYNGIGINTLTPSNLQLMPYDQLVDAAGKSVNYSYAYYYPTLDKLEKQGYLNWRYNYIDELNNANNMIKANNFGVNLGLEVPIYKGISFTSKYAIQKTYQNAPSFYSPDTYNARNTINSFTSFSATGKLIYGVPVGGILNQSINNNDNYSLRNQLSYNSSFSNNHLISAIAGIELRENTQSGSNYTYFGYNDQAQSFVPLQSLTAVTAVTNSTATLSNSGSISTDISRRFISYFANASYTFRNKYTVSASGRLDSYNNFGYDKKYRQTPLWSSGISWHASEEEPLRKLIWINNLNLRLTYGINGNISLTNLPFTNFSAITTDALTQQPYVTITGMANPAFTWEKTGVLNTGIDFALFKNRLGGSIDYYQKNGRDLLYSYQLDPTFGSNSIFRNGAQLNGKGVDIGLNVIAVATKDWTYTPGFSFSYNNNTVISLPVSNPIIRAGNVGYLSGLSTNYLFIYRWAGLDKNGQSTIYDQNNNIIDNKTALTSRDALKYAGVTTPPYYGALNQNVRYKNFNLFMQINYKFGYVFLKQSLRSYQTTTFYQSLDLSKDIANRWRMPGDEAITNVPGLTGINSNSLDRYSNSDIMLEPGDHIRLRQITLSYNVTERVNRKLKLSNLSFNAGVRDLGILWRKNKDGIDPDFNPNLSNATTLPPAVSFTCGLNANF